MENYNQNVIKHKTGLLKLAEELDNISKACRIMGFSRDTFYRYQAAKESGGIEALFYVNRRKTNFKNRVDEDTEKAVINFAFGFPAYGQIRVSNELRKKRDFRIYFRGKIYLAKSLSSIYETAFVCSREEVCRRGLVLTEAQVRR